MFLISLFYFIFANSWARRRESTFRPWNTVEFGLDARERETGWILSKTQKLNIYQKKKRCEYILLNKYKNLYVESSIRLFRNLSFLLHGSRYFVFPRGRNTLWRFAMHVWWWCLISPEIYEYNRPIVVCHFSVIPLLRERCPLPSLPRCLARRNVPECGTGPAP